MSSSPMVHPDDRFGESEHKNFLSRLFQLLEYYRKKISSLVIYIPIGEILISCFNYLCSFLFKHGGAQVDPIEPMPVRPVSSREQVDGEENLKILDVSEEVRQVEESFNATMTEEREKLEQRMQEVKKDCEEYERKFEEGKAKSLKRIQEIQERAKEEQAEKDKIAELENQLLEEQGLLEIKKIRKSRQERHERNQRSMAELDERFSRNQRIYGKEDEARKRERETAVGRSNDETIRQEFLDDLERCEDEVGKDETVDLIVNETAEQFGRLSSREKTSELDLQNSVALNERLINILDGLESVEEIGMTPLSTKPQKKKNKKTAKKTKKNLRNN